VRGEPRRIAIFRMVHLGDTVIALPALWTVRRRFPNARILYLTQEHQAGKLAQGTEVLRPGTVYDELVTYRLGSKVEILRTLLKLRLARIDTLVYIPSYRTPAQLARDEKFFRLAGVRRIIGMQGYRETDYRPKGSPLPTVRHEADILLSHLAKDGVQVDLPPSELRHMGLSDEERTFACEWLRGQGVDLGRPVIGIGPGSKMTSKLWPIDRFIEIVRGLDAEFSPTFIVFGGPAEQDVCQQVADAAQVAVNSAGKLTVRQSTAVFEYCQLYLGNDTGTMHLAASAGVPCVAVFSARDWPGRWYPFGEGHAVHRFTTPCEGCLLEVCDRANLCLTSIAVAPVLESAQRLLRNRLAQPAHAE